MMQRMAKGRKKIRPLNHKSREITAPTALVPLMQAFSVDSDEAARALVTEAARTIYGQSNNDFDPFERKREISDEELDAITSLMKGINPSDTLETLYAAQIVASHMLGMHRLSAKYHEDQKLGLKLLRFSNEAMQQLDRRRHGGNQNITVNYNYHGQNGNSVQTVIPEGVG